MKEKKTKITKDLFRGAKTLQSNRKSRGITLVALIITIIILLILASVTINLALNNNGIFNKAKLAIEKYKNEQEKENTLLGNYENAIEYLSGTNRDIPVEDYTNNLIYKLNLENLSSQQDVTIYGNGLTISNDKKILTLDGATGIEISDSKIDPNGTVKSNENKTMCCWYNKKSGTINSNNEMIMCLTEGNTGIYDHYLMFSGNSLIGLGHTNSTLYKWIDPSDRCDSDWHFIASVFKNNNEGIVYYDGVPFSTTGSYQNAGSFLHIGYYRNNQFYTGDLADIRLYNSALTKENIKQLYAYGKKYLGE